MYDAKIQETGQDYYDNFSQIIESIRRDINRPDLPVLLGQVNPPPEKFPSVEIVRDAQKQAADLLQNVSLVRSDGIPKWDDNLHYSSQGQLELGKRFARSLESVISAQSKIP